MAPSGRFKENGPTTLTAPELVTPTAQAKEDVSTVTETSHELQITAKTPNHAHPHDGCGWFGVFTSV
jgi:hypothetical protein